MTVTLRPLLLWWLRYDTPFRIIGIVARGLPFLAVSYLPEGTPYRSGARLDRDSGDVVLAKIAVGDLSAQRRRFGTICLPLYLAFAVAIPWFGVVFF